MSIKVRICTSCAASHGLSINAESPTFPSNLPLSVLSARMRFNCDAHLAMRFLVLPAFSFKQVLKNDEFYIHFVGLYPQDLYIYDIYIYILRIVDVL